MYAYDNIWCQYVFNLPKFYLILLSPIFYSIHYVSSYYSHVYTSKTDTSSDSNSGSSSAIPIIAGAVGGAVLFVIILLCVVFLYRKYRLHKQKAYSIPTMYPNADAHSASNNYSTYTCSHRNALCTMFSSLSKLFR